MESRAASSLAYNIASRKKFEVDIWFNLRSPMAYLTQFGRSDVLEKFCIAYLLLRRPPKFRSVPDNIHVQLLINVMADKALTYSFVLPRPSAEAKPTRRTGFNPRVHALAVTA